MQSSLDFLLLLNFSLAELLIVWAAWLVAHSVGICLRGLTTDVSADMGLHEVRTIHSVLLIRGTVFNGALHMRSDPVHVALVSVKLHIQLIVPLLQDLVSFLDSS